MTGDHTCSHTDTGGGSYAGRLTGNGCTSPSLNHRARGSAADAERGGFIASKVFPKHDAPMAEEAAMRVRACVRACAPNWSPFLAFAFVFAHPWTPRLSARSCKTKRLLAWIDLRSRGHTSARTLRTVKHVLSPQLTSQVRSDPVAVRVSEKPKLSGTTCLQSDRPRIGLISFDGLLIG